MASSRSEYWLVPERRTYTIYSRRGVELDGIETIGSAQAHLDEMVQGIADQDAADAAAIEAQAFEDALDEIRDWINARGGYAASNDPLAKGTTRAVIVALAAIDAIGMGASGDRRAA